MPFPRKWSPEVLGEAERLCRGTDQPLREIVRRTGVPYTTLAHWVTRYGWRPGGAGSSDSDAKVLGTSAFRPRKRPSRPRSSVSGPPAPGALAPRPDTPADLAQKLEAVAARAIAVLEAQVQAGKGLDPERTAKALSALTQTLKLVAGLGGSARAKAEGEGGTTEPPPRSLAELRAELLRHCRRLRAHRRPRGGAANIHPG